MLENSAYLLAMHMHRFLPHSSSHLHAYHIILSDPPSISPTTFPKGTYYHLNTKYILKYPLREGLCTRWSPLLICGYLCIIYL